MMENLNNFQKALKEYGVPDIDVFQTVDLYEKKDISNVTSTLFALGRAVSILDAHTLTLIPSISWCFSWEMNLNGILLFFVFGIYFLILSYPLIDWFAK